MQTDLVINVKDPHSDNPVVPETSGNNASSPNTGFLTVDGGSNHNSTSADPFFLLGVLGITMFIAMAVFLIVEKIRNSKNPQAAEAVADLENSIIANFSQHLPRDLAILIVSAAAFSFVGLSYSHFFYDTTVNAEESVNKTHQADALSITASSTSKIDVDLEDSPVFAYIKDTITVTSPTEAGYTLTANIVGDDKDLINISNPEASDIKIAGLDPANTSASPLTNNTWGLSLTEPTSKDDSVFYGLPTGESTSFTIIDKNTATEAGDTTDIYYGTYITPDLLAGTYSGVAIEYTAIANAPATLDTGRNINAKLKSLAAGTAKTYTDIDESIKSIDVHLKTPAPAGFVPSETNTISSSDSKKPIYIVFDNTNDTGIMHFYTEGNQIVLSPDSSHMFSELRALADLSDISSWDTSNVTNMDVMFSYAGYSADTFSFDLSSGDTSNVTRMIRMFNYAGYSADTFSFDLSSWNTSKVTHLSYMFYYSGRSATTWSVGDLSSWDTSNVTNMSNMFSNVASSATTWSVGDLSSWNTSKVTDISFMFYYSSRSATTWSVGDLSSWDTSKVTNMSYMFSGVAPSATTLSFDYLSSWNTSNVTNMSYMFSSAGYSAPTFSLDLSSWDTSKVTNMSGMFFYAGSNASTFSVNLSSWDTSSVTNMNNMFDYSGRNASTWSVVIPSTNGNNINNTTSRMYGQTTSIYGAPFSGKSFTLAQS